jgi:hypothetical protein
MGAIVFELDRARSRPDQAALRLEDRGRKIFGAGNGANCGGEPQGGTMLPVAPLQALANTHPALVGPSGVAGLRANQWGSPPKVPLC